MTDSAIKKLTLQLQSHGSMQEFGQAGALLAGVLDSAMDGIITVDAEHRIVLYNRAAEQMFGWPVAEVLGESLDRLLPESFRGRHQGFIERFAATGVTSRRMGNGRVVKGRRSNGAEFPLDASISQLHTPDGPLFTVILRDVSERVHAQQEREAFAIEANAMLEQEKTRVARELHDDLAQSLTALKMDSIWVRDNLTSAAPHVGPKLAQMLAMLDDSIAATRRIAADLRPLLLDDLGLVPAIEWLALNFTQRSGIPCALAVDEELELHEPYATAVFRIVQESLVNVAKHAQASQVEVGLKRLPGEIMLWVWDNGRGFVAAAPRKPNSLGLMGLRERAQLLGGSSAIHSGSNQGTRIEVRIPLPECGAQP